MVKESDLYEIQGGWDRDQPTPDRDV